jgi:hypothetical protein
LAALTGTAYIGPMVISTQNATQSTSLTILPGMGWKPGSDGNSTAKINISKEYIEGQEKEVLNLEVDLIRRSGYRYGQFILGNETVIQRLKGGSGVRLKILGDGKRWYLQFATSDTEIDYAHYEAIITTRQGRVLEVDIPYSRLRQPEWGRRAKFNKNDMKYLVFERRSETETGGSIIKVFDFEIY